MNSDCFASAISNKDSEISELKLSIAAAEKEIAKQKLQAEDLDKVKLLSQSFDSRTLSKQCPNCLEWFPVAKLEKDKSWSDIHSEEAVHFDGKTYRSNCN